MMKFIQKPIVTNSLSTFLRVDKDTFAELIDEDTENYRFKITFKISLSSGNRVLSDYDKVKIKIKNRDSNKTRISSYSNSTSQFTSRVQNKIPTSLSQPSSRLKPNNGLLNPSLPSKVSEKLYSGLQLLEDLEANEDYLEQKEVSLSPYVSAVDFNRYFVTELYVPNYRKELTNIPIDPSSIDPLDTMQRINKELIDITTPVSDSLSLNLTSETDLKDPERWIKLLSSGKSSLFYDILIYYLSGVSRRPDDDALTWYENRRAAKDIDYVDIETFVSIKKGNKNTNLDLTFDLYKRGSNVVEETYTTVLYMSSHVEAFKSPINPPSVSALNTKNNSYQLFINDIETDTESFNVYMKSIFQDGSSSSYIKIGNVKKELGSNNCKFSFVTSTHLSVVRIVPVNISGNETNIFTNTVVGPGYKFLGRPIILPSHFGKSNAVKIDVLKIPNNTSSLALYRRDCTENMDSSFQLIKAARITPNVNNSVMNDTSTVAGRIYEYYLVALSLSRQTGEEIPSVSNYALFKNIPNDAVENSIIVSFTLSPGSTSSFQIKTTASKTENERITESLKTQLGELYSQYLDPSNNGSSPLGDDKGIPQYSDLFFHEIIRTNLNTGDRETFDLVNDGVFEDNLQNQKKFNIKPLNPQHDYIYSIFTYRKNPIELFKKFVARGTRNGKEWFYYPYKWKNPSEKRGKLFADDDYGVPVVDTYESLTSEAYGLTASYRTQSSKKAVLISEVFASRIDRNTVKISWNISTEVDLDLYDSFIVMKVVNGVRSFVGKTQKNYIYHEISENDIGSVYYIIIPIMSEFDIGKEAFSNDLLISPEGITKKTKITERQI